MSRLPLERFYQRKRSSKPLGPPLKDYMEHDFQKQCRHSSLSLFKVTPEALLIQVGLQAAKFPRAGRYRHRMSQLCPGIG